jgi:sugar phosphate isomerase/epimerase
MKPWSIGLSTGCFYMRRIFDVMDAVRESGFESIEVCSFSRHLDYHNRDDVRDAGKRLRRLGLRAVSFHAPFSEPIDITALDSAQRGAAVRELILACDAAAAMEVENLVLHPGPERQGRPDEAEFVVRMRHAAESLNLVAGHCRELGIHLVLENMLPHLLFGHINDMLYLLGSIRDCNVGTCLDTGHAFLAGELDTVIHKLSGHLHLVHVNDNLGDRDAHLPPGEGAIQWSRVLGDLKVCQFNGTLILELALMEGESVTSMLARARDARAYLEKLMLSMD